MTGLSNLAVMLLHTPTPEQFWAEYACQRKPVRIDARKEDSAGLNTRAQETTVLKQSQVVLGPGLMGDFANLKGWSDQYLIEKAVS